VLRLVTRRALAYEANAHIFVLWMLAAMLVLLTVAIVFLRNQIRPILRLARAAEDFGKGRDLDFSPHGAREVRQAGYAFIEMKRRVERATEQRTAMLNGVSHDLRTILTRFKLSLALLDNSADSELLQKDVDEMGQMLEGYLAFARGDTSEATTPTDIAAILEDVRADAERHGAELRLQTRGNLNIPVRPIAMKRCIGNLVTNAQRHAEHVEVSARRDPQFVSIVIDDDGSGIPQPHREDVFRPFYRLDEARNQDEGGAGLGLAIARDIARSHGGDIMLSDSPMGGLRAAIRIPV
jgi:two-component system osmolarity sensor histidine kinase EnvZ